jgi:mannose-6-phosphate isomerase-like protein (cupin superfamily)
MIVRDLSECSESAAGDGTLLRELLHPAKTDLKLNHSLAHAVVKPGKMSRPHRLRSAEVYYILDGQGVMHIGLETAKVRAGQAIYVPPNSRQYIENTGRGELKFLCIVDPPWRREDEEAL